MRLERDDGLEHRQRRGIGGRFGLARLAKDALDLGNLAQHAILDLRIFVASLIDMPGTAVGI